MKIFNKNTKKCDRCEKPIDKKDKAYCFHNGDDEVYICAPCVIEVYNDYKTEVKRDAWYNYSS
jgi:hypothetical protein